MMHSLALAPQQPSDRAPSSLIHTMQQLFPREMSRAATHAKRSFIYHQGSAIAGIYCLLSGTVAVERLDEDGRMAMFGVIKADSLLAWQDVMEGGVHRNGAEALTECEVAMIPRQAFTAALHSDMRLVDALMRQTSAQVNAYEDHMVRLSTLELSKRIYSTLCSFAESSAPQHGAIEVTLPLLKRDLAALIGTTPESLSRCLRRLEDLEVAEFKGKNTVRLRMGWEGEKI